jgi:hypothetical protein
MGRFDNLLDEKASPATATSGRFDNLISDEGGRFNNLLEDEPKSLRKKALSAIGGTVGKVGRVLSAGSQATAGVIERGLEETGVLEDKGSGFGIVEGVKSQKSNVSTLQRIGKERGGGVVTGDYEPTTSVFGNFIRELPSTAIGVTGDIFLDPTFVLGKIGTVKKGVSATVSAITGTTKKIADKIPAVQKIGDILGQAYGRLLIPRFGQSTEFAALDRARKIEESLIQEKVSKLVSPIIEKPAFIQKRISQVIKGSVTTDDELRFLAEPIREELDRVGESISNINPKLLNPKTFEANKGTYFPRLYTDFEFPKTEEGIVDTMFASRAVSIPKAPFKARTLTEAESLAKGTRIEEAGYPAMKRLTQLEITEARQKFYQESSKLASTDAKPGWIQLSDDKALGDLAGKFLPAAEYRAIAEIRRMPTKMEEMYGNALSLWKTFKTAYNPASISRNDLTNFFVLNPLGGVGLHRLDIYAKTLNEMHTKGHLYQMARNEGLEISTQQAAELTQKASRFYRENDTLVKQFFNKIGDFHKTVTNFYGSQDKFFKLANFIKGVTEDGMTPADALRRANFYLVDYSEVPELIKWARKSPFGVPFISFTYGVSKPLAKTLLERPDKLAAYFKILNGIQNMNPSGETQQERQAEFDVAPEWIQEGTYLRLPTKDKHGRGQYIDLQYILPTNVLEKNSILPTSPALVILSSLISNKDTFRNKDLTLNTDTPEEKAMKRAKFVVQQLVPSLAPFGYSFNKITALLQNRPDANGFVRETLPVLVDILGGIKITPIDPTIEAQKRAYEKRKDIEELRSQLRRIMLDKTIFPEEKEKQAEKIRSKLGEVGK